MKTCPHCGTDNPSENSACCNCFASLEAGGTAVKSSTSKAQSKARPQERPRNVKVKSSGGGGAKALVFLLVIALLAGGGYIGYNFFLKPTPEKTIAQLASAMNKLDIDACMACMSSDTQNLVNQTRMLPLIKQIVKMVADAGQADALQGSSSMKVDSVEYTDADHAIVVTTTITKIPTGIPVPMAIPNVGGQQQQTIRIPMIKEEGKWKIDGVKAIENRLRSLPNDQLELEAKSMKIDEEQKASMAKMYPQFAGINMKPVEDMINREIQRRSTNKPR